MAEYQIGTTMARAEFGFQRQRAPSRPSVAPETRMEPVPPPARSPFSSLSHTGLRTNIPEEPHIQHITNHPSADPLVFCQVCGKFNFNTLIINSLQTSIPQTQNLVNQIQDEAVRKMNKKVECTKERNGHTEVRNQTFYNHFTNNKLRNSPCRTSPNNTRFGTNQKVTI